MIMTATGVQSTRHEQQKKLMTFFVPREKLSTYQAQVLYYIYITLQTLLSRGALDGHRRDVGKLLLLPSLCFDKTLCGIKN